MISTSVILGLIAYAIFLKFKPAILVKFPKLAFCFHCMTHAIGLHLIPSKHKRKIHLGLLGVIAYDAISAGAKIADFGWLTLALLMEGEDAETHAEHKADPTVIDPVSHYTESKVPTFDLVEQLQAYESDLMTGHEEMELFQYLVNSGIAWQLQGSYGRRATQLLKEGKITDPNQIAHDYIGVKGEGN